MLDPMKLPPKREPKPKEAKSKSIYLDDKTWALFADIAHEEGYRSRNELVSGILKDWVADYLKTKG